MHNIFENYYDFEDCEVKGLFLYSRKEIIQSFRLILMDFVKFEIFISVKIW